MKLKIFDEINQLANNYNNGFISLMDGLTFNQYLTIRKIEYYSNSRYLTGDKDELGRDKPFYNITNLPVNVAVRATDLDVKDIKIVSDNPEFAELGFLYNHEAYEWMKEAEFSRFLNNFGQTRARYGGVLVKKCIEKDEDTGKDELEIEVVPWKNVITDQVNISSGVIIEKHYMLPSELAKYKDTWENVPEAMNLATKQQKNLQGGYNKANNNRIPIYEAHGEFAETLDPDIGENGDPMNFKRMCFIVAGESGKQVLLWKEEEKENPYKYLSWEHISGRGLGRGVVENGFEAQRWTNDAVIGETNAMTLSGKVVVVTDSDKVGENAITDLVNGSVIQVEQGRTAHTLQLLPSSFTEFGNIKTSWANQIQQATNSFDAVTGETMPSGTPLGSLAIQAQQAASYFDYKREEAGIFITEIFNEWILPFLAKKINKAHILSSEFSPEELKKIDDSYAAHLVNVEFKDKVLSGVITSPEEYWAGIDFVKNELSQKGKRRFLDIDKDYFKNFEPKVSVIVTKELKDLDAEKKSLEYLLMIIAKNPMALQDPTISAIVGKMAEYSDVLSPAMLSAKPLQSAPSGTAPTPPQATAQMKNAQAVLPQAQQ